MTNILENKHENTITSKVRRQLKKFLSIMILLLFFSIYNPMISFADDEIVEASNIKIIINEEELKCDDVPVIINGRTMLPFRAIITKLGVKNDDEHIIWDGRERSVTIIKDGTNIKLLEGDNNAYINDELVTLDVAPFIYSKNDRMYVPVRFIAQQLDQAVVWEPSTYSVYIHRVLTQKEIWEQMHLLVNSKVITQDEIDPHSKEIKDSYINELIAITEKADYDDKDLLIEILQRWKKGDFRSCVEDHNYLWDKEKSYVSRTLTQREMWETIHKMANSKIISRDNRYYGITKIETSKVNELIAIIEKSDYDDKSKLLDILYRWKNGDFRKCVEDHNYVWRKLGGEVGEAVSLMIEVEEAMKNYKAPIYTGDKMGKDVGKAVSLTEEVKKTMATYTESQE